MFLQNWTSAYVTSKKREVCLHMKLNYKRTTLIGLAFLSISAFWQMYDNVIPLILKNTFQLGETYTGVIMAADNILALFLLVDAI